MTVHLNVPSASVIVPNCDESPDSVIHPHSSTAHVVFEHVKGYGYGRGSDPNFRVPRVIGVLLRSQELKRPAIRRCQGPDEHQSSRGE